MVGTTLGVEGVRSRKSDGEICFPTVAKQSRPRAFAEHFQMYRLKKKETRVDVIDTQLEKRIDAFHASGRILSRPRVPHLNKEARKANNPVATAARVK